jgi:hypothetical protein
MGKTKGPGFAYLFRVSTLRAFYFQVGCTQEGGWGRGRVVEIRGRRKIILELRAKWFRGLKGRGRAAGREHGCLEFIACSCSKLVLETYVIH